MWPASWPRDKSRASSSCGRAASARHPLGTHSLQAVSFNSSNIRRAQSVSSLRFIPLVKDRHVSVLEKLVERRGSIPTRWAMSPLTVRTGPRLANCLVKVDPTYKPQRTDRELSIARPAPRETVWSRSRKSSREPTSLRHFLASPCGRSDGLLHRSEARAPYGCTSPTCPFFCST